MMQTEAGMGRFCYVCADELTKRIYRVAGRSERGAFAGPEVPEMAGALAATRELYLQGRFAKVLADAKKTESSKKATQEEKEHAAVLSKAVEESFTAGFARIDELLAKNDKAAAREVLGLMEEAFKGTSFAARVSARKKDVR
jgi:hypothetical protein